MTSSSSRFTLRSAVYLMLIKDSNILLLRRFNTGWMDGKYSLVSGHLDGNESITNAMIREAQEEAGITLIKKNLIPATVLHRKSSDAEYIDFFFVVKEWEGKPKVMEPDKCDNVEWFPLDNLPENVLPHIKEALHNYKNTIPFSESGW
ncbi:MAG TPA: NUDIX domain-containing protein [Candidatus Eisenbacteria bacterium]|nr:NUDIX domain-containing protein [Candidatus Eisenbacteria bacterium]